MTAPRPCVFLDRDGVVNVNPPPGGYIRSWDEFRFLPAAIDWIRLFNALGLLVIVVTNQRGVALGLMSEADLADIHGRMLAELARQGARIDDVFYCPHQKDACQCRKPKPGLIHAACEKWNIDLDRSLFLGDSDSDAELAARCSIPFLRVAEGRIIAPAR